MRHDRLHRILGRRSGGILLPGLSTGPWTPVSPTPGGHNVVLWYDADDASTFTHDAGSDVDQWRDKSGGGLHLTPSSGGAGGDPTRTGTWSGSGKTTVVCASGQSLTTGSNTVNGSTLEAKDNDKFSFACAFKGGTGNNAYFGKSYNSGGASTCILSSGFHSPSGWTLKLSLSGTVTWSDDVVATGQHIVIISVDGTNGATGYIDGKVADIEWNPAAEGTVADNALCEFMVGAFHTGAAPLHDGGNEHAEHMVFDGALSAADVGTVYDYFDDKWNSP